MPGRQRLRGGVRHAAPLLDSPLNSIWDARATSRRSTCCAMAKEPDGLPAFLAECELARGSDPRLDAHLDRLNATIAPAQGHRPSDGRPPRGGGPRRGAPAPACWCRAPRPRSPTCSARGRPRRGGRGLGTLPAGVDARAIVDRAAGRVSTLRWPSAPAGSGASRSTGRERGNAITLDMPRELADAVRRQPRPRGARDRARRRGQGLRGGYDSSGAAARASARARGRPAARP